MNNVEWSRPSGPPVLSGGEIHLWYAAMSTAGANPELLREVLSEDELRRAGRFYFDKGRTQFTVTRGVLRLILGRYLKVPPDTIAFSYNRYGKPLLNNVCHGNRLRFNVSHSAGRILYAVAYDREVGVDIESIRSFENAGQIVERFFSEREKAEFLKLPECSRNHMFFTWWTRKEAYTKALGKGMTIPFDQFSVSSLSENFIVPEQQNDFIGYSIKDIMVDPGYVAAVAAEGPEMKLSFWRWTYD